MVTFHKVNRTHSGKKDRESNKENGGQGASNSALHEYVALSHVVDRVLVALGAENFSKTSAGIQGRILAAVALKLGTAQCVRPCLGVSRYVAERQVKGKDNVYCSGDKWLNNQHLEELLVEYRSLEDGSVQRSASAHVPSNGEVNLIAGLCLIPGRSFKQMLTDPTISDVGVIILTILSDEGDRLLPQHYRDCSQSYLAWALTQKSGRAAPTAAGAAGGKGRKSAVTVSAGTATPPTAPRKRAAMEPSAGDVQGGSMSAQIHAGREFLGGEDALLQGLGVEVMKVVKGGTPLGWIIAMTRPTELESLALHVAQDASGALVVTASEAADGSAGSGCGRNMTAVLKLRHIHDSLVDVSERAGAPAAAVGGAAASGGTGTGLGTADTEVARILQELEWLRDSLTLPPHLFLLRNDVDDQPHQDDAVQISVLARALPPVPRVFKFSVSLGAPVERTLSNRVWQKWWCGSTRCMVYVRALSASE